MKAPWTEDQVNRLNSIQLNDNLHPFTCGECYIEKEYNGVKYKEAPALLATENGWVCLFCDYTQDWAHVI